MAQSPLEAECELGDPAPPAGVGADLTVPATFVCRAFALAWLVLENFHYVWSHFDHRGEAVIELDSSQRFFEGGSEQPVTRPRHVQRLLPKPHRQWKKNHSAYELAHAWLKADDIPVRVWNVLETWPVFSGARLLRAFFEHKTDLRTAGRESQTDLLVELQVKDGLAVVGVKGKARETFGRRVSTWLSMPGDWKKPRLDRLCTDLELGMEAASGLRYQLLHRTAATLYEAEERGARVALMLVHSFSPDDSSFDDFRHFTKAMCAPLTEVNAISGPVRRLSRDLYFGWVSDRPAPA